MSLAQRALSGRRPSPPASQFHRTHRIERTPYLRQTPRSGCTLLTPFPLCMAKRARAMQSISDIHMIGMNPLKPPRVRKEPYIDLSFKLNEVAPPNWCEDFNNLVGKESRPARIDPSNGLFIETWVRKPEDVQAQFDMLKEAIQRCSEEYIRKLEAAQRAAAQASPDALGEGGEQGKLNRIIEQLDWSAPVTPR